MTDSALRVVDLDLRLVGYFAAVAEDRHFGRAAAALRVAQPSLTRQIRRLEQQIGVRLSDRTPQSTRLTEPGEVFLPRAKALPELDVAVLPGRRLLGCGTTLCV
jgi:DNA-binding transcriptional LysR family regulator